MEETAGNVVAEGPGERSDAGLVQGTAAWEQRGFCKLPFCIIGILRTSASREIRPFKNHLPSHPHKDITQCQVKAKQQPIWAPG